MRRTKFYIWAAGLSGAVTEQEGTMTGSKDNDKASRRPHDSFDVFKDMTREEAKAFIDRVGSGNELVLANDSKGAGS